MIVTLSSNYPQYIFILNIYLFLGIWGGKGQGKTFQTELIFRAMGVEPVIMSAGELESEKAGDYYDHFKENYVFCAFLSQSLKSSKFLLISFT